MTNIDRFFQDLDTIEESPVDLSSYGHITKKREFLDLGTIVTLKEVGYGDVTIIDRLSKYQGKLYDYAGEYDGETGSKQTIFFDEDHIQDVKKKEGMIK